ncbi:MAG: HAD family hydrolase [Actinomycetota bacterium]
MWRRRFRALIVDFGGVLTTSIDEAFRSFCEAEGIDHERLKGVLRASYGVGTDPDPLVARMETGRMDRREFERRLAEALSEDLDHPLDPTDLLSRMLGGVHFDLRMVKAVHASRRRGVKTALLSNSWGVEPYPRQLLDELFDAVVISGEVGIRKPDPEVFRLAAGRLGLPPGACVFVDDVEGNVKAARGVGMRGLVHEHAERTVPRLERLLRVTLEEPPDPGAAASISGEVYR